MISEVGGGGGEGVVGDLSKKYPADLFRSEKIVQGYTWGKIYSRLKKYPPWLILLEKNLKPFYIGEKIYLQRFGEKKVLPKPNHPYFSSKVDLFARLNHFLILGYAR